MNINQFAVQKNNTQHSHNRNVERFILFPLKDIILCKYIDISVDRNNFYAFLGISMYIVNGKEGRN